jgi:branched-chain amino acid aminotransferase
MTTTGQQLGADLWPIELHASDHRLPADQREAILADPGFGKYFTDHMVTADWTQEKGWHNAQLLPYGPLSLDPATNFMHYGQAIFEGLKAYRHADGSIKTFRPIANAERFQRSARRLAMAELPVELFLASVNALVSQDRDWVPDGEDHSLYLRPFMI